MGSSDTWIRTKENPDLIPRYSPTGFPEAYAESTTESGQ
jgi:hypothetical protein